MRAARDHRSGGRGRGLWGTAAIGGGSPVAEWAFPGSSLDIDFTNSGIAAVNCMLSQIAITTFLTTTRATPVTAYSDMTTGVWLPFAANIPRITDKGLLVEEARTNVVLQCRDFTNASWVKTNITAAKDQTGIDGVANSASSILATAGNGTALLTTSVASSARWQTAFVQRITGSGVVNMTMDNGVTWTAITVPAAGTWGRVSIPAQTLANPIVGFQIVTNTDKIAVDFVQNENGTFATSPILTAAAAVTRAADVISLTTAPVIGSALTLYISFVDPAGITAGSNPVLFQVDDGSSNNFDQVFVAQTSNKNVSGNSKSGGSSAGLINASGAYSASANIKAAYAVALSDRAVTSQGAAVTTSATRTVPIGQNSVRIGCDTGSINQPNTYIKRTALWAATRLTNLNIQALTT